VSANAGAVRRAIGRKPGPGYARLPAPEGGRQEAAVAALTEIDAALSRLAAIQEAGIHETGPATGPWGPEGRSVETADTAGR
jgi:hypothetical protein